jgi:succinate-acetate transporter protein
MAASHTVQPAFSREGERQRRDGNANAQPGRVTADVRTWLPADPVPLGLSGFAITTAALSWILLGILPKSDLPVVIPLAIFFGGGAQLLAGMWAFAERNTFAAAAFSGYGAFWLSFWLLNSVFVKQIPKAQQPGAEELYLILWAIFTFYLWIASFRVSVAVNTVLALLVPAYVLIAIGTGASSPSVIHIGAGFGLACAVAAAYTAFAHVLNRTFERELLPLGTRAPR